MFYLFIQTWWIINKFEKSATHQQQSFQGLLKTRKSLQTNYLYLQTQTILWQKTSCMKDSDSDNFEVFVKLCWKSSMIEAMVQIFLQIIKTEITIDQKPISDLKTISWPLPTYNGLDSIFYFFCLTILLLQTVYSISCNT